MDYVVNRVQLYRRNFYQLLSPFFQAARSQMARQEKQRAQRILFNIRRVVDWRLCLGVRLQILDRAPCNTKVCPR